MSLPSQLNSQLPRNPWPGNDDGDRGDGPTAFTRSSMATVSNNHSFASSYMDLCKKQRLRPLPMICVTLPHSLDFTTDRVKMDDWKPILNSLSFDRTLRSISVRSKYQCRKWLDQANSESKARMVGKTPVVLTRYLLEWLTHSLSQCVRYSNSLTNLELEGVPVPEDCLVALCVGLGNTTSLQHLSLQRCYIGDGGCEVVCRTVANIQSIKSLNLSQCELTSRAGPAIASALSRQKLSQYHDAWKESLRYREPKLENMPGLRRLTLNGNPKLGNEAVTGIIEAIGDSLWFKALDLQQCGLSDDVSRVIIDLLNNNKTLVVLDVRLNSGMREETQNEIMKRLDQGLNNNNLRTESEYRWINVPGKNMGAKRVSSAGSLHKQKQTDNEPNPVLVRPKSAMIRQVKRPVAPIVFKKPLMPTTQIIKRIKTKSPLPVFEKRVKQPMKPLERARPTDAPKVSLHLDLLAQIQSLSEPSRTRVPMIKEAPTKQDSVVTKESMQDQDVEQSEFQRVVRELMEVRSERDGLESELRRKSLIIAEERASREFAEQKLESVKYDLTEVQEILREREQDCRGYFLMSQKSMDEICQAFGKLMYMLEESTRKTNDSIETLDQEEDNMTRDDIKRRFALIIRKTKSENLKRGYFVDDHAVLSRLQMTARYGRSEGNIRTTIEPLVPMMRVERHIGDTAETIGLPKLMSNYQEQQSNNSRRTENGSNVSGERARALFASFMNGSSPISFSSYM